MANLGSNHTVCTNTYVNKMCEQAKQQKSNDLNEYHNTLNNPDVKLCKKKYAEKQLDEWVESGEWASFENNLKNNLQKSLEPFGQAVYEILTENAEITTGSDELKEQEFWQWIFKTQEWMKKMSDWQAGVLNVFKDDSLNLQQIKAAIRTLENPGLPPNIAPTELKGKIK